MNLAIWLERAARTYPDAPALLLGTAIVANYTQFRNRAASIATALRDTHGIVPGDRVAVFLPNRIEYLDILYGIWFAGATAVPINAKLHPREVAWMVENSGAKLLVASAKSLDGLRAATGKNPPIMIDADGPDFKALYQVQPMSEPETRRPEDVAWLFYTSGTTGRPKGVMITHGNLQAMALSYFADVDTVEHEDVALYAAPISHGAGIYNFMFVLRGARHVIPESGGFDVAEIFKLAKNLGNLCMFAAPTMVRRLVAQAQASGYAGEGLKTIVYGGGPMYVADILEAVDCLGSRFAQIYGQGESPMTITVLSKQLVADRSHPRWRERLGSVGVAQSVVDVIIADKTGKELPHGEIGEILVSGAAVMKGYWHNDAATKNTLKNDWLWTGDMGAMDEDRFLTLHDRSKDMIVSGGTNIYPREVEEVLLTHPAVAQVSVVGKPDPEWGEVVIAFVVCETGQVVDAEMLGNHCLENIARFKRPKEYVYLTDLPKNAYGKVLKTELRERLNKSEQSA